MTPYAPILRTTGPAPAAPLTVAVTGAAGFIGSALTTRLAAAGHTVHALDLRPGDPSPTGRPLPGAVRHTGADVRDPEQMRQALTGVDAVYHLAGPVAGAFRREPGQAALLQHAGTVAVLDACRHHHTPRVILASSFYVYSGQPENRTVDETTPLDLVGTDLFGATKLTAEHLTAHYARTHPLAQVTLRFGSVYGPGPSTNAVAAFLRDALTTGAVAIWGDRERRNQYTHLDDITAGAAAALTAPPGTYNLVHPDTTTTADLAAAVAALTGARIRHEPQRPSGPAFPYIAAAKARTVLGWNPRPLHTGLAELHAHLTHCGGD